MTNVFLSDGAFYEAAHAAFGDAGISDVGTFSAQGAAPVPCKVFVDRNIASALLAGYELTKDQALVRMLRAGIAGTPRENDVITVDIKDADGNVAGSETFTIARRADSDEGSWVFVCRA